MKQINFNIEIAITEKGKSAFEAIGEIKDGNTTHRYAASSVRESLAVTYVLEQIANDSTLINFLTRDK